MGLLVLSPLAVQAGRVRAAVDWLDDNDLRISFARLKKLSTDRVRRVWKYQKAVPDPVRSQIFGRVMTFAPSLILIVRGTPGDFSSTAARLTASKGPSDPFALQPHHLRFALGAANMFNNLVHTSDGPDELVREASSLLSGEELTELRTALGDSHTDISRQARSVALEAQPRDASDLACISLAEVAVSVKLRILSQLRQFPASEQDSLLIRAAGEVAEQQLDWLRRHRSGPLDTLDKLRAVFERSVVDLPSPVTSLAQVPTSALMFLYREVNAALHGRPFNPARWTGPLTVAAATLTQQEHLVFLTEWLSCRVQQQRANALRMAHDQSLTG